MHTVGIEYSAVHRYFLTIYECEQEHIDRRNFIKNNLSAEVFAVNMLDGVAVETVIVVNYQKFVALRNLHQRREKHEIPHSVEFVLRHIECASDILHKIELFCIIGIGTANPHKFEHTDEQINLLTLNEFLIDGIADDEYLGAARRQYLHPLAAGGARPKLLIHRHIRLHIAAHKVVAQLVA